MQNRLKIPREIRQKWRDIALQGNHIQEFEVYEGFRFEIRASRDCVASLYIRENAPVTYEETDYYVHDQLNKGRLTINAIKEDVMGMIGNLEAIQIIEKYGLNHEERFYGYR